METILQDKRAATISLQLNDAPTAERRMPNNRKITGFENLIVWWAIKMRIFWFACIILRNPVKIVKTFRKLLALRNDVWGGDLKKLYKVDGRYYFNLYTPGWPSAAYDHIIRSELKRHASPVPTSEKLRFIFLAITRKCPLRCEHCFEWDNLNQKESFTRQDLLQVMELYQKEGVQQFHFSGGEPMTRLKDMLELLRRSRGKSECWVVSSGFNLGNENAGLLKAAGCFGVVISIDHYLPALHNGFRGNSNAFTNAVTAVHAAREAGLVVAVSACVTKSFIEGGHLLPYTQFAHNLGVQFVQLLEPRNIGHYQGQQVLLEEKHLQVLEDFFKEINHHKKYDAYPTVMYHGYHQRRVGCFSGSRSIYIDSAGDVHACPFCHTKSFNIIQHLRSNQNQLPQKENTCPLFNKIA
jgi:MoaA/NifB/PqqE/SkfB family radical SAM enzyme